MPEIEIQDLKREAGPISRSLIAEIRKAHSEGRQSILFLNRRGFSYYFHCRSCGYEMTCKNCSVSLTFHKSQNQMICHYCGYRARPVDICPECRSIDVGYSGYGTEHIEEEIARIFPDLIVKRIDTDTVRKKQYLRNILADFRAGKIDILLGTQMVAKGLNFPGVKLVGIISADTGLQLPDFRAAERTFNLIVQVSGRAGRSHPDGKVIIQTFRPDNETIRLAAQGKLDEYYRKELRVRKDLNFPPFSRLIRLVFRAKSSRKALKSAQEFMKRLSRLTDEDSFNVLGPAECPLSVIAGNHRWQLLFQSESFSKAHRLIRETMESFQPLSGVYVEVDVDPVSLL
ncbi:Primosomal protein N' [subsurface metagenome]